MHSALTSGLLAYDSSKTVSPPMLGRPRQFAYPPTPATTPGTTRRESSASRGPNRRGSMTAIGRAPIARMSRTIPPTPVAAPWYGPMFVGRLCDYTLNMISVEYMSGLQYIYQ